MRKPMDKESKVLDGVRLPRRSAPRNDVNSKYITAKGKNNKPKAASI